MFNLEDLRVERFHNGRTATNFKHGVVGQKLELTKIPPTEWTVMFHHPEIRECFALRRFDSADAREAFIHRVFSGEVSIEQLRKGGSVMFWIYLYLFAGLVLGCSSWRGIDDISAAPRTVIAATFAIAFPVVITLALAWLYAYLARSETGEEAIRRRGYSKGLVFFISALLMTASWFLFFRAALEVLEL